MARWGRFERVLLAIAVCALALRAWYTLGIDPDLAGPGDFYFYHWSANLLADGKGYIDPFALVYQGESPPTAMHPPMWSFLLTVVSFLGGTGEAIGNMGPGDYFAHRLTGGVVGTVAVVLIGLLGRRVGGDRVGLVAAGTAALYPLFILRDGSLHSESLYGALIAADLLLAYRLIDKPTYKRGIALGVTLGVTALTREESLLLIVLLLVPLAGFPKRFFRRRVTWRVAGAAALAAVCVVFPWTLRNWIQFGQPVSISTGSGGVWVAANCDKTYDGDHIGFWEFGCIPPRGDGNEAQYTERWRQQGIEYAQDHLDKLPLVVPVRVLRTWSLYDTFDDPGEPEQPLAVVGYLLLLPLAVGGFFLLRSRRRPLLILLAPPVMVTLTSIVGYGTTRFRHAAEISIVVLAALSMVYLWDRRRELASIGDTDRVGAGSGR